MRKLIILGNPNVGKSTLFNTITKSKEHTGNFHGVTVKTKSKQLNLEGENLEVVDLPGIYSLNTFSYEEEVAKNFLLKENGIRLMLVDANSLRKNLYLSLQLNELNLQHKILINNYDYFIKNKNKLNLDKLKLINKNIEIINAKKFKITKKFLNLDNFDNNFNYLNIFFEKIKKIYPNLNKTAILKAFNGIFENLNNEQINYIKSFYPDIIKARYNYIDTILNSAVEIKNNFIYGLNKSDKFLLNPVVMIVGFLLAFFASVYVIFFWLGAGLSNLLIFLNNKILVNPLTTILYQLTSNIWLIKFFEQGILSSVSTVLTFLPQVALLFMFLTMLEDSGIIARMSYVFDDIFSAFGLTGKAIYIMLMGLGCNTMSTYASRNMNSNNLRIKTAILNPYISCLARLPILVIVSTAIFGAKAYFVVAGLYMLGIIILFTASFILNKTILTTKSSNLLLEFPPLRKVDLKHCVIEAKENAKDMLKRILTLVLCFGAIVWCLSHTQFNLSYTENFSNSIIYFFADKISILFKPIGLNNAGVITALIVGLMAKELIVSTLSITNMANSTTELISSLLVSTSVVYFNKATAVSFLVFVLLYCPCISNIAVLKKEVGGFFATFSVISQLTIAYLTSFVAYTALTKGIGISVFAILAVLTITFAIIEVIKKVKHNKCLTCGKCN